MIYVDEIDEVDNSIAEKNVYIVPIVPDCINCFLFDFYVKFPMPMHSEVQMHKKSVNYCIIVLGCDNCALLFVFIRSLYKTLIFLRKNYLILFFVI